MAIQRRKIQFDHVVNAVEDLRMDPTGDDPIDDVLDQTLGGENILVEFPPGEYFVKDAVTSTGISTWGMMGTGEKPEDVRFTTDEREDTRIVNISEGTNILVENFALDSGSNYYGGLGLRLMAHDTLRIQDIHILGANAANQQGGTLNLSPQILDSDGVGVIDGLERRGPTDIRPHRQLTDNPNPPGIMWMGPLHKGTLYIRNSYFAHAGENGIYASACPGDVRIENCSFINNNQAAVRIGGEGSYIRDSRFFVDAEEAAKINRRPLINPNMVVWETNNRGEVGGAIEQTTFIYKSVPEVVTGVWVDGSAGGMTIRDCHFQVDCDNVRPIRFDDPIDNARLGGTANRPWGCEVDTVTVTGKSTGTAPLVHFRRRPASLVRKSCIEVRGDRDGIEFENSDRSRVVNSNINVTGRAIVSNNSATKMAELTYNDSCPDSGDGSISGGG